MKARIWLPVVLALGAFGVAGCGGGDDEPDASTPVATAPPVETLGKEDLLAQGDAICAEVNAAIGSISAGEAETAARVAQEAGLYEGMVDRLKDLGVPDEATGYEEFIGAANALAAAQDEAALAAARGDTTALQAAESEASSALASFQSAARAYGFEECSEEPSAPTASSGSAVPAESEGAGGVEDGPVEEAAPTEVEEAAPEEAPETGGAGGGAEAGGGTSGGGGSGGGTSGGIGPG